MHFDSAGGGEDVDPGADDAAGGGGRGPSQGLSLFDAHGIKPPYIVLILGFVSLQ